jgi:hypothetical protein
MRRGKIAVKRRVWIGLVSMLTVTVAWWIWTRSQDTRHGVPVNSGQPFVRVASSDPGTGNQFLRERTEYFDPTPLFFPTKWNFGQSALRESMRRQPGDVFGSFEAKHTFSEQNIKPYSAEATAAPERLVDVLAQGNETPYGGMGQIDMQRPALLERSGFLEVKNLVGGKIVIEQALNGLALPHPDFAPLEFLVAVSSTGIVGEPVIVQSISPDAAATGDTEEVDSFFRSYLVKTFRLGERLNPGRYRVLVGP